MVLSSCLTLVACGGPSTESTIQEFGHEKRTIQSLSESEKDTMREDVIKGLKLGMGRYDLNAGDVLEIMYHIDLIKLRTPYRVGVQDEVNVEFQYHPGLNRTVIVRPDGKITLPIKGDFEIGGETPEEGARIIKKGFSDIIRDPVVTVTVNKFSSKIFALQKAITNSPRGQAKRLLVSPDGYVYAPLLDGVQAAGKTIDELKTELQELYACDFKNLQVSLLLESIRGRKIFVFGQVKNPGKLAEEHPIMVSQAIAEAGGITNDGALEHVKVLLIGKDNQPIMRTVNLKHVMNEGRFEEDVLLPDNSIIFVPRTDVAKTGKWVDDYIRRILTWDGFVFNINYQMIR